MLSTPVLLSSLLLSLAFLPAIPAYKSGAPASVCHTMLPGHGKQPQPLADSPYHVQVSSQSVMPGGRIAVSLTSHNETEFKGFLLKAVDVETDKIVGTFTITEEEGNASNNLTLATAQYLNCTHDQSSITHTSNVAKLGHTAEWSPPDQFAGSVVMVATFVKDGYTYWVNVTSDTVQTGQTGQGVSWLWSLPAKIGYFLWYPVQYIGYPLMYIG
eukprot:GFUD01007049.1.p1 GENE.GFUD01007049.1~~GFUD01007049.1.p1  ORF type:complete len:214 (+),score=54.10 GFUD01007049.1:81-722(+)